MALRLNTVEYAFPQIISTAGAGVSQNFSQITVDIPETTNRTFISAFADIFTLDANATTGTNISSWALGLRVGSSGNFLNQTETVTLTQTGEQMSAHFIMDVSSQFINNFTGTSHVVDASFALGGISSNNTSCKLVITYQWDDTDQTRIKTVRIPLESSTGALGTTLQPLKGQGTGGYDIPALDTWLPEASKAYKDIFFETWVNEGTTAAQAPNPSLGYALDSEAVSWDMAHEDSGASARLYRRIWQRKDMTTNVPHLFRAQTTGTAASMPFRMLGSLLNVTYTYYEPDTTSVMSSIMLAGCDEVGRTGSTTSADMSRFRRTLSIPENNPQLKISGLLFSFIDSAAVTMNVAVGSQAFTTYSNAANVVCGGYMFYHNFDASSRKGAGITLSSTGSITIDWYTTSQTAGSTGANVSSLMYLNYTADKSTLPGGSANHTHTVIPFIKAHSAASLLNIHTVKPIDIPEENRWIISICPVLSYQGSVAADYVIYSAELDSSTSIGAGWVDLYVGQTVQDAEFSPMISFSRARTEFRRWPYDTDTQRMYVEKSRSFRFQKVGNSIVGIYWPISYHTIINTVSGQVTGYSGDGSGINIMAYDESFLKEVIYEGSTNIGGQFSFPWYNPSTNIRVGAYQDSTHKGMYLGPINASANIDFGSATASGEFSWTF